MDIPKTLERLEALAVPVIGYKTNVFPAFYSRESNFRITLSADSPQAIANIYNKNLAVNINSGLLVANPVPIELEIPKDVIDKYIALALKECEENRITGKSVTPFLLKRIVVLTKGDSLKTNIALALNNVRLATEIAAALK